MPSHSSSCSILSPVGNVSKTTRPIVRCRGGRGCSFDSMFGGLSMVLSRLSQKPPENASTNFFVGCGLARRLLQRNLPDIFHSRFGTLHIVQLDKNLRIAGFAPQSFHFSDDFTPFFRLFVVLIKYAINFHTRAPQSV